MSKLPVSWESISFVEGFDLEGGTQPPKSTFRTRPTPGYLRMYQIQDLNANFFRKKASLPKKGGFLKCYDNWFKFFYQVVT